MPEFGISKKIIKRAITSPQADGKIQNSVIKEKREGKFHRYFKGIGGTSTKKVHCKVNRRLERKHFASILKEKEKHHPKKVNCQVNRRLTTRA